MWLAISLVAALAASAAYLGLSPMRKKYRLGFLALMLWGMAIMVFVDRLMAYLEGGPIIEATTDGLIADSALLGVAMLVPILLIWAFASFTETGKRLLSA